MSQQKPCGYGNLLPYRGLFRAQPEIYERFKQLHRENMKRIEEHYQQKNPVDLEERIERGYN